MRAVMATLALRHELQIIWVPGHWAVAEQVRAQLLGLHEGADVLGIGCSDRIVTMLRAHLKTRDDPQMGIKAIQAHVCQDDAKARAVAEAYVQDYV